MQNTISVKTYTISLFCIHDIEGNVEKYSISYLFLYNIKYKLRYRARYRVYYIVLTSEAYDRTGSCPASSCQPSFRQWFGCWSPNGLGWASWSCGSGAVTVPYCNCSAGTTGAVLVEYAWLYGSDRRKFAEGPWFSSCSYTRPITRWHQHPRSNSGEQCKQYIPTLIISDIVSYCIPIAAISCHMYPVWYTI